MDTFLCNVSIVTPDGVKYYDVPLSPEQLAWIIQHRSAPEIPREKSTSEDEKMNWESLMEICNSTKHSIEGLNDTIKQIANEVTSEIKSIAAATDGIKQTLNQHESVITEISGLKQAMDSLVKLDLLHSLADHIIAAVQAQGELLSNNISSLSNSVSHVKESLPAHSYVINDTPKEQPMEEHFVQLASTLKNISYNIDQMSRRLNNAISTDDSPNRESNESVFQRLMYKLVDMPIQLYERTSKRLLYKEETDSSYDTTEMKLILTYLKRYLEKLGLEVISSEPGTSFDSSTMEIDDEHEPIDNQCFPSQTVAYSVMPRLVWRETSGMPESMQCPEKVILTK